VRPLPNRKAIRSNSRLPIRYKRKPLTEIILGDLLIGLGTASANSNSDPESVGYLNFVAALTPTLVRLDFFHFKVSAVFALFVPGYNAAATKWPLDDSGRIGFTAPGK
jgi:hypothetical protein